VSEIESLGIKQAKPVKWPAKTKRSQFLKSIAMNKLFSEKNLVQNFSCRRGTDEVKKLQP